MVVGDWRDWNDASGRAPCRQDERQQWERVHASVLIVILIQIFIFMAILERFRGGMPDGGIVVPRGE